MMRFLSLSLLCLTHCDTLSAATLRAGAAVVTITPPTGYPMWGYADRHDEPSQDVLDPLYARALVLEVGETRIALVGLDLGRAPTRASYEAIQRLIEPAHINEMFLVASHTHHGPVIELDDWPTPETSYVRQLETLIAETILKATQSLQPAQLGVIAKEVPLNRNRHSKRNDPPVDRELLLLKVLDSNGMTIAHVVNFAAHPTMYPSQVHQFSADYPGHLCKLVEERTHAPCLFLQGAAGDLSPNPPVEARSPAQFGQALATEVLTLSEQIQVMAPKESTLMAQSERFRFLTRIDLDNVFLRVTLQQAFFPELIAFFEREYADGVQPLVTTALLHDEIGFVGISGELFCGHALSLKRRARLKHVFVLGYCNDYHQYFPTIEATAEGGYGAVPPIAMAEVGAGERLIDAALIELYRMRGQIIEVE